MPMLHSVKGAMLFGHTLMMLMMKFLVLDVFRLLFVKKARKVRLKIYVESFCLCLVSMLIMLVQKLEA